MLNLPDVTLCCVDAKNHILALRGLNRCRSDIRFARTIFLTDAMPADVRIPADIAVIPVGPITSHEAYSRIILKDLYAHVTTSHALIVQWDGYVAHSGAWTDEFLEADYLGAPWPDRNGGYTVGNGGFSLRSRKLLEALQDDSFPLLTNTEDVTICGHHRSRLEFEFAISFGSVDLAQRFSFEMDACAAMQGRKTFGFHGLFNLFLIESDEEVVALCPMLSDSIASSETALLLLKNLLKFERYTAALALAHRILAVDPENEDAADVLVRAREQLDARRTSDIVQRGSAARRMLRKILAPGSTGPRKQ
jgi:Protein of unknown function (DUF5672)